MASHAYRAAAVQLRLLRLFSLYCDVFLRRFVCVHTRNHFTSVRSSFPSNMRICCMNSTRNMLEETKNGARNFVLAFISAYFLALDPDARVYYRTLNALRFAVVRSASFIFPFCFVFSLRFRRDLNINAFSLHKTCTVSSITVRSVPSSIQLPFNLHF